MARNARRHHPATQAPSWRRPRGRRRWHAILLVVTAVVVGSVPLVATAPAQAAAGAASVSSDPRTGFPEWYEDGTGMRLQLCLDPQDAHCTAFAAEPGFDPAQPVSFPDNFPSEAFYSLVESDRLSTPGCAGTAPGRFSVLFGLEAAFANGAPAAGEQMVFGRVRVNLTGGLCPSTAYTVTHPYGQLTFTTDAAGSLARNAGTTDVGCAPVAPDTCDWTMALESPVLESFLRWDPTTGPAAPEGYLGDAATPHEVVGAPFTEPGQAAPANYVKVVGPGLAAPLQTPLFTVAGKLAGPLSAVALHDFGGQAVDSTSPATSIVVTNLAGTAVTPAAAAVVGADAADFAVAADGCAGVALARDESCTIEVTFAPTGQAVRTARLVVGHDTAGPDLAVGLRGTGTAPPALPGIDVRPASLDLGRVRVGVAGPVQQVTVTSTGEAPLQVSGVALGGAGADQFRTTTNTCAQAVLDQGTSCTIGVGLLPTVAGDAVASLDITSNAPGSPSSVALTGTGVGGVAAVSPEVDPVNGMPAWYQDENGIRLGQCIDADDPRCVVLAGGTWDGSSPLSFPDSYPDEWFYYLLDSDEVTIDACGGTGTLFVRAAVEAAFVNGEPVDGEQMTFGRIRVRARDLCPNTAYTVVHPFGTDTFTTTDRGDITSKVGTDDVGCLAAAPGAPCDFSLALRSRVLESFPGGTPPSVHPPRPATSVTGRPSTRSRGLPTPDPGRTRRPTACASSRAEPSSPAPPSSW